jgi:hypothetical protein
VSMATSQAPVLNLNTLIERAFLTIDGDRYELLNASELSVFDYKRFEHQTKRLLTIEALNDVTEADEQDYTAGLDAITRRILLAPDAVHAKLTTLHRAAILQAFITLSLPSHTPPRANANVTTSSATPTGAKPRRGSRASTAEHRKAG